MREAAFFALPNFQTPKFHVEAILTILPALLLVTSEHIGHQIVTGKIVGRDLLKRSGTSPFAVCGFLFDDTLRSVRFRTDHDLWREHWRYGSDQGLQRGR